MNKTNFLVSIILCMVFILFLQHNFYADDIHNAGDTNNNGSSEISKKRIAPIETKSLVVDGIRYDAPKWGKSLGFEQNGGHLRAVEVSTNNELWILEVYKITYDGDIEDDKLDRFITMISLEKDGVLRINSERCAVYLVDLATREISIESPPPC